IRVAASRIHVREVDGRHRVRARRPRCRRADPGPDRRGRGSRRTRARPAHPVGTMNERPFEIRDDLRALPAYRAPQADAAIRLNTNESPWPPPKEFATELAARLRDLDLNRYPDREARALRE